MGCGKMTKTDFYENPGFTTFLLNCCCCFITEHEAGVLKVERQERLDKVDESNNVKPKAMEE